MTHASVRSGSTVLTRIRRSGARHAIGPLVGRQADVDRVLRSLACTSGGAGSRIVTILGPPGIGKTRLAERCLELAGDTFAAEGGAWFVDLGSVTDSAGLLHAVASALQSEQIERTEPGAESARLVDHFVAAGPMLLVLDNFEHLVWTASLVQDWCHAAPELSILVTSRERLGVEGEIVVELGPLALPTDGTSEEVLASDAVQLLVLRAKAAGGDVGGDVRVLADLVRHLDGIPLAIELAAARMRVLRPDELLTRLVRQLDVLSRRPLSTRDRHATLTSAIDWSWQLLSPEEQRALAECSLFAPDFSVDAAEKVLGADGLEIVAGLRDKSLLHSTSDGRLALYASIREFAASRLAERGPAAVHDARLRHARCYAERIHDFVESRTFLGSPDAELRARAGRDQGNLLAALAFLREASGPLELIADLALALTLLQGAPAGTCLDALGAALAALDASGREGDALVTRILLARHNLLGALGHFDESRADLGRLLAADLSPTVRAVVLFEHGVLLRHEGRTREARLVHLEVDALMDGDTPPRFAALQRACLGRLGHELRDEAAAREHNERARVIASAIEDAWIAALPIANLALLEQELGSLDVAQRLLEAALDLLERAHEPGYVAVYSIAQGDLLFEAGRPGDARACYERAARFFGGWCGHRQSVELHGSLAALEARYGTLDEAELHLEQARRALSRRGSALLGTLVDVHAAQLTLRRARDGHIDGAATIANVRAFHEATAASEAAETTFVVRFALRMLAQSLEAVGWAEPPPRPSDSVVVARDGAWFARSGAKRVDLSRRGALRRILGALVDAGKGGLGRDALLAHGWPGERVLHDAASTRLRVAVSTLRSLGLRDAILTQEDGYALDPKAIKRIATDL